MTPARESGVPPAYRGCRPRIGGAASAALGNSAGRGRHQSPGGCRGWRWTTPDTAPRGTPGSGRGQQGSLGPSHTLVSLAPELVALP